MMPSVNNSLKRVACDSSIILWELPKGIPDPSIPCEIGKEDLHPRSDCPKSTGRSCWVDVFQYILHGSRPVISESSAQTDEAVNSFRHELGQDDFAVNYAHTVEKLLSSSNLGLSNPQFNMGECQSLIEYFKENNVYFELKLIEGFCKQDETKSFRKYSYDLIAIEGVNTYNTFFKKLGASPLCYIPKPILQIIHPKQHNQLSDYPIDDQYKIVNIAGRRILAELYKFPSSSWNPSKDISLLFDEVKEHGVIGFGGLFGKNHYSKPPHVVLKIMGNDVYGWNRDERKKGYKTGHCIAVVGVKKEVSQQKIQQGQVGHVIYVDPMDGMNQRIFYALSYATFKNCVNNEFNVNVDATEYQFWENGLLTKNPSLKPCVFGYLPNPSYQKA